MQCCESPAEERGAVNLHATFCGNRRRATASGDPVRGIARCPPIPIYGAWRSAKLGHWDRRLNATQSSNFKPLVFGEIHAAGNIAGPRYLRSEGMATVGNFKFLNELAEFDMLYLDHNGPPLQEYGTHGCGTKLEQSFHEPAMAYDQ